MSTRKVDVIVLGAGIIGTAVASELQSRGRKVLLIDKGDPGYGCSYGNAGWITPCFATPLPQPGMFLQALKWMMNPDSPFYIKPQPSAVLIKWLLSFMRNMNEKKMHQSIDALTAISIESIKQFKELHERNPNKIDFIQNGLLMICETDASLKATADEMQIMVDKGIEGRQMTADEVIEFEPSVRKEKIKGGVYYPQEAHSEPLATVEAIWEEFKTKGGETISRAEVYDFETDGSKITKVKSTQGDFEADLVVWALGSWSEDLGKKLNVKIPVLGGKGYSVIVSDEELKRGNGTKPTYPMLIVDRKIAVTPRSHSLRLAGTLELVKGDYSITPRRVRAIMNGSREFLKIPAQFEIDELWRGLRPCTPDGVPMIGFSKKWSNLFYCTGHQMLGLQSAPGSARLAAELIAGETPYVDAAPFDPGRYPA